jgi:hypothetical protein
LLGLGLSDPDCKPVPPIRQTTTHVEGTKYVAPQLPDEGQNFLAILQTKVQGEKKQLDVPPLAPMKWSSLIKAHASRLKAAVSKPSASPPKLFHDLVQLTHEGIVNEEEGVADACNNSSILLNQKEQWKCWKWLNFR